MSTTKNFMGKSALLLSVLVIAAVVLSFASYEYSTQVSANVANLSTDEIHANTQIEASDLGHVLENSLESVSSNLNVIANSVLIQTRNVSGSIPLFTAAENSTKDLTYTYFWLDGNGRLLLSSNGSTRVYAPGTGSDLSNRTYFVLPKQTMETFFSSATPSLENASKDFLYISRSVLVNFTGQANVFAGVVGAAIELPTLGSWLKSDLSPQFKSTLGLLDFKGGVLYSGNESLIGVSIFSSEIQNTLPAPIKQEFDSFVNQSLSGHPGYEDLSFGGASSTLAYQPVFVNATTSSGSQVPVQFGVLYVSASDALASSAAALINQERTASLLIIFGIAGFSGGLALTILRWNRRLDEAVKEKTADLVNANAQLATKARAEKDLMNITAHELRTPTQSILANSEILRRVIRPLLGLPQPTLGTESFDGSRPEFDMLAGDIQPQEVVDIVDSSYRNAQRLQKLTQNILEVARIDNNTLRLDRETFDLNDLAKQSISDIRVYSERDRGVAPAINIIFEPRQKELMVNGDRTKLGEVMTNLLENSIRFTPERGVIRVTTDKNDQGFAVTSISDNGSGIDPDIFPQLFRKFVTKSGTGLGLYISKAFVEAHGGTITAANNSAGGATFTFTIPLQTEIVKNEPNIPNVK